MKKPDPTYQELIATAQKLFSFEIADGNKINIFQELKAKNIPHLAHILEHKECKITSLGAYRHIGPEGIIALANALKDPNCKITELSLGGNSIGLKGTKALATVLKTEHNKITSLYLHDNDMGTEGAIALANALQSKHCKITTLELTNNKIGPEGAIALATTLKSKHCKITTLILRYKEIGDTWALAIADALQHPNCKITYLCFNESNIGDAGAEALANALQNPNCKITSLTLHQNLCYFKIGPKGASSLAKAVQHPNCKITSLDLFDNNIRPEGAFALATALQSEHCKINTLCFYLGNIGDAGAKALANALQNPNCKITSLDLFYNDIGPEGTIALANALKDPNCKITELNLLDNDIGPEGAFALATALQSEHCKITSLILQGNIGTKGAFALAKALIHPNCKITSLNLCNNGIGLLGDILIHELIKQNKQILHLKKITSSKPILENRYIGGESKQTNNDLHNLTSDPNVLSQIVSLITDRAKTLSDNFESQLFIVDSSALKENIQEAQDTQTTLQVLDWVQHVYKWIWKDSIPCYRTVEIFKVCHKLVPNIRMFENNFDNTVSSEADNFIPKHDRLTFLEQVLHRELSDLMVTNSTNNNESLRVKSLFETMIQLDIDQFMMTIIHHYEGFLPQALHIIYQLLENNPTFRQSPKGLKTFQHFVECVRNHDNKIELNEFTQASSWALDFIKNNPEERDNIKQSIRPYVAKFFKDNTDKVVKLDDDPIELIKSFKIILQINNFKSKYRHYAQGIFTQAKKVDLACTEPSPLDATLKTFGLHSPNPSTRKDAYDSLQQSRVKTQALDLAGLERKKVKDKDDRHPLAYDAMERFETVTKPSPGA